MTEIRLPPIDTLLDALARCLDRRIAALDGPPVVIGVHSGGVQVRDWLLPRLSAPVGELGALDISWFRDDYDRRGLPPAPKPSRLPVALDDRDVVLVDDVLHTGRTVRAALDALFELGRPRRVLLAVLVDRGGRELPIAADCAGARLALPPELRIELDPGPPGRLQLLAA